jgi:transcriptional regulator with XRE-family HTH domain
MAESVSEIEFDGTRITEARGERTLEEVADACGISRQALWQIERGHTKPSADVLVRLCRVLDMSVTELTT